MDDDGRGEGGRARLARGTKPQALIGDRQLASADDRTDGSESSRARAEASGVVRSSSLAAVARTGPVPASVEARGSGPVAAVSGRDGDRPAAQSICEAVEQLIEAREADDAIAEWMREGG